MDLVSAHYFETEKFNTDSYKTDRLSFKDFKAKKKMKEGKGMKAFQGSGGKVTKLSFGGAGKEEPKMLKKFNFGQ